MKDIVFDENGNWVNINADKFTVEPMECGTGKTFTTEKGIIARHSMIDGHGTFYFTRQKAEGQRIAKKINEVFRENISFAINEDTIIDNRDLEKKLQIYPIIIATHRQYEILAQNKSLRKKFTENRDLLILDEWISLCSKKSICLNNIIVMEQALGNKYLLEIFEEIVSEIKNYMTVTDSRRHFFNAVTNIETIKSKCRELNRMIKNNLEDKDLQKFQLNKKQLCQEISDIAHFYNGTAIIWNNVLHTVDRTIEYWKLSNNIILDASAFLNGAYDLNPKLFEIADYESVLDYKNWNVTHVYANSSMSGKDKYIDYYGSVKRLADILGRDKTLIVDDRDSAEKRYKGYHSSYFANLRSNNDYKDFKNVIIAKTPYIPDHDIVLEYLYFSGKTFCDENDSKDTWWAEPTTWNGRNGSMNAYELENQDFEKYRKKQIASDIYQAIKRVNRNMSQDTEVVIITKDIQVFNMVVEMLPNCNIDNTQKYDKLFKYKRIKNTKDIPDNEQPKTYVEKVINLFKKIKNGNIPKEIIKYDKKGNIIKGIYQKSAIGKYIGIDYSKPSGKTIMKNKVIDNITVKEFMEYENITVNNQNFIFP